jgi:pimeloyl-ACP methyl ester carboxylesterase
MSSSSTTTTTTPDATATTASARTAESQTGAVELAHVEFFGGGSKESATSDHEVSRRRGDELWLPPVLLLHGLLGNKRNFATVANSLKNQLHHGRSRRLIGLDLRNHGACAVAAVGAAAAAYNTREDFT